MLTRLRPVALLALAFLTLWTTFTAAAPRQEASLPGVLVGGLDGSWRSVAQGAFQLTGMDAANARLRFPASRPVLPEDGFTAQLVSGDVVHGTIADGGEEALGLRVRAGAVVSLPIESMRLLRAVELRDQIGLDAPEAGDRLWRRVGKAFDRIDGLLVGFSTMGVTFEGQLGESEYPWNEVGALWIEPLGELEAASGTGRVAVDLVDGSRLRGAFERFESGKLFLDVGAKSKLVLESSGILEVNLDDARLRFVSDLAFESVGPPGLFGDDLGLMVPPVRDRSVVGTPLLAREQAYAHGLGVHAPSRLRIEWKGGGVLRGKVAIDDSVKRLSVDGAVIFRVHLDGKQVFESKELTVKSGVVTLPAIDLTDHQVIELEVNEASRSVMGDRADWLDLCITQS
jgi:hypothetical protein